MPPRKAPLERNLPTHRNELMTGQVDESILSSKCRVQDVRFGSPAEDGTTETFVRIKTQIPNASMPHFIMRKAEDDYISATSMYRAVFYKSTTAQEKHEMDVIKKELAARSDENASGVWIPGAPDALRLADLYGIRPWVQALLDAPITKSSYPEEQRSPASTSKAVVSPQQGSTPPTSSVASATPSRKGTRERSQSPRKAIAASSRKVKKVAKEVVETITEDVDEVAAAITRSVQPSKSKATAAFVDPQVDSPISKSKTKPSAQIAELAKSLVPNGISSGEEDTHAGVDDDNDDDEEATFSAKVDGEGQSVADMVAEARAQVKAAQDKDAAALIESGLEQGQKSKKRDLEVDDGAVEDGSTKDQVVGVKRNRLEDLEVDLVQERRKVRALFGLVIGLGATAVLPYLL